MRRSDDRILTTHVGSLIRPKELLALGGAKDDDGRRRYAKSLREQVAALVKRQADVGIDIINDGEFGKSGWANYSLERLSGFEARPDSVFPADWLGSDRQRFGEFMAENFPRGVQGAPGHACIAAIEYRDKLSVRRDVDNLTSALQGVNAVEGFLTAVAPASVGYDSVNEHYASERDYVFAIATAMREEYQAIAAGGLVLQVDDAVLANMYDHLVQQSPAKYREWAQLRVDALNHALQGIPEDRIRYHVCFGSWHVPHVADAALEDIVGLILQVKAGGYSIESANPRHEHEWRVWEQTKLPNNRILFPGVVTHHTTTVEHPRVVADRIVRFARILGRGKRGRKHRLWLCAIGGRAARTPAGDVGKARQSRRGGAHCER